MTIIRTLPFTTALRAVRLQIQRVDAIRRGVHHLLAIGRVAVLVEIQACAEFGSSVRRTTRCPVSGSIQLFGGSAAPAKAANRTTCQNRAPCKHKSPSRSLSTPNLAPHNQRRVRENRSMRTAATFLHPRDEILQAIQRIYRYRMTTTSGGNLSIREENGDIWITPARLDKGSLRREDIVCVSSRRHCPRTAPPSSELPFHQEIYRTRPDIRGIVHAHPVALVAFSLVHVVPDTRLFHQTPHVCGDGRLRSRTNSPAALALGQQRRRHFRPGLRLRPPRKSRRRHRRAPTSQEAFHRFETLEFTAKTIIKARLLGDVRYLTDDEIAVAARRRPQWTAFPHREPGHARKRTARAASPNSSAEPTASASSSARRAVSPRASTHASPS